MRLWAPAAFVAGLGLASAASPALAEPPAGLSKVLSGIELRYNSLATLRLDFEQELTYAGRPARNEKGTLYLWRPAKMRWEYDQPKGKLLVGDGEMLRMYSPYANQVRQVKFDETGDMRAPLAFLLGRLNFRRAFRKLRLENLDGMQVVVGEGRTGEESYRKVEFHYEPGEFQLSRLRVLGRDDSVTTFRFTNEQRNPRLDAKLFEFEPPQGADVLGPSPALEDR